MGAIWIRAKHTFQFWTPDSLRGYGVSAPNGSLWTIPPIVEFYLLIWFVYKWLDKRSIGQWLAVLTLIGVGLAITYGREYLPVIVGKLLECSVIPYIWIFLIGYFGLKI